MQLLVRAPKCGCLGRGRTMPKKGGDIDLHIELPPEDYGYARKVRFWCELVKQLGDQKIDIVINKTGASPHLPIHDVARTKGIRL